MKKKTWTREPSPDSGAPRGVDLGALGFEFDQGGDVWMERLREAARPYALGNIGPFAVIEEISRGGQGVVFRAHQPGTGREIALKRMAHGSFSTTSMRLRFEREVAAAAALNHPGIVTVYGMERVEGLPVCAMEWVDGVSTNRWAAGERSMRRAPEEILEVFLRITDAVQHAHSRGILHRDLKPTNVLVDTDGGPHVLDFGLALRLDCEEVSRLTMSGDFLGTPAYASPEQLLGEEEDLDVRTDVYSLGVMLFEMLTGASPYGDARAPLDFVRAIESGGLPRASTHDPRLAAELDTILAKALARDREQRYGTAQEFAADIRRHLAGEPIRAVRPSLAHRARKFVRRHRVAASFLLVIALFSGFLIANANRHDREMAIESTAKDSAVSYKETLEAFLPKCLLENGNPNQDFSPRKDYSDADAAPATAGAPLQAFEGLLPPCLTGEEGAANPDFERRDFSDEP